MQNLRPFLLFCITYKLNVQFGQKALFTYAISVEWSLPGTKKVNIFVY